MKETHSSVPGGPTADISAYISAAIEKPLPELVAEKTKCHLLDSLAAMISGSRLKPGMIAAKFAKSLGGPPDSTVAGTDILIPAVHAAMANGMAAHADETDDSHLGGRFHPGCAIVPAALAVAEREKSSGNDLLRAVALGYDIGARSTMALGFSGPKTGTHSTHSLGAAFGSAAASGALLKLSPLQTAWMLSYTVQQASGVPYWHRDPEHIEKSFDFGGMGARNGVYSALMAAAGCSGVPDALTGEHSYLSAFAEKPKPEELTRDLGKRFEIMAASIKKWCVGSPIQAALDSLLAIINEHEISIGNIKFLTVHMPDDRLHIVNDRDIPDICLQHLLAVMVADGGLTFASAHDVSRMSDPEILELRKKIKAVPSPELTVARPARQSIIEIETHDGRHLK
ncbi:MAG: MmgE/PrpD family protein, partial [Rhodospirillales bacterium]|nr:MmgE/PrpD family protein [Rhodospirillales bacterium]